MLEEISSESEVHTHRAALEKLALEFSTLLLCQSEVKDDLISSARPCYEWGVVGELHFMFYVSQDGTVAVPTQKSTKTEEEVLYEEEGIHTQQHRNILMAENVTEAKQMLLIHQVGTARFILLTCNLIKVMNLCI